jgi:Tol biopolymer transport system component
MGRTAVVVAALVVAACGGDDAGDANAGTDASREPADGGAAAPGDLGMLVFVQPDSNVAVAYTYVTAIGDGVQPVLPLPAPAWQDQVPYYAVQWSPDAALTYYIGDDDGGETFWLDPRDPADDPVTVAETGQPVAWSPDGSGFLFGRYADDAAEVLFTPMMDGRPGEAVSVASNSVAFNSYTAWSPDATTVRFLAFPPLGVSPVMQVVSRNGRGWSDPLMVPTDQPAYDEVTWPLWSTDSRSMVYDFRHYTPQGDEHTLEVVEVDAPDVRNVLAADPCISEVFPGYSSWAPDGSRLIFWVREPTGCRAHVARRTATGWTTRQLKDGLRTEAEQSIVWSPDSRHLLRRSDDFEDLLWCDAGAPSTDPVVITAAAPAGSNVTEYKLSPDLSKLAVLRVDGSGPSGEGERRVLYIADMSAGAPGELVEIMSVGIGRVGAQIAWAPDSSRLSVEGGEDSAIVELASGAIAPYGTSRFSGWSPDSRWIALVDILPTFRVELTVRQLIGDELGPPILVAPDDLSPASSVVGARWAPKAY